MKIRVLVYNIITDNCVVFIGNTFFSSRRVYNYYKHRLFGMFDFTLFAKQDSLGYLFFLDLCTNLQLIEDVCVQFAVHFNKKK